MDWIIDMNVNEDNNNFKTTFWDDFTIADKYGKEAIQDTYNRASKEWKHDLDYLIELVKVLNWKCWDFWQIYKDKKDEKALEISELYKQLYYELDSWAYNNLDKEQFTKYVRELD